MSDSTSAPTAPVTTREETLARLREEEPESITWTDTRFDYVVCCYGSDGADPGDWYTRVGHSDHREGDFALRLWWFDDGDDDVRDVVGPFDTEESAAEAAEAAAKEQDEADGLDAEAFQRQQLEEARGEEDPSGAWCVYWDTALDDSGPRERYETQAQAEAACELANAGLHAQHPGGNLLCGFEVRRLDEGEWVRVEET